MEESAMQECPICGITRKEQEFQQQLVREEHRKLRERWEQHHSPNELPPGLPVTYEHRVHYALWLYENDSSMEPTVVAISRAARTAGANYEVVVKALDHADRVNKSAPGLPLTDEYRVQYALFLLDQDDSSEKPDDEALALAARKARVNPDLVAKAHATRA